MPSQLPRPPQHRLTRNEIVCDCKRMPKDPPISVRLEPDEREAIEQAAREDDRPVSALVRKIVVEWLRRHGRGRKKS